MKAAMTLFALGAVAACSPPPAPAKPQAAAVEAPADAPAGDYVMDPAHTSVNFRVSHMGLSRYTARFTGLSGKLAYDPAHPSDQSVTATLDASSLQTNYPEPAQLDFDALVEKEFLDAAHFPQITFRSTKVDVTGPRTGRVTGDLTLHGVTRPIVLEARFNGGYKDNGMDPLGSRIGFSAHGVLKRSAFGISYGLPAPGTAMGVGDDVDVVIEAELTRKSPASAAAASSPPPRAAAR